MLRCDLQRLEYPETSACEAPIRAYQAVKVCSATHGSPWAASQTRAPTQARHKHTSSTLPLKSPIALLPSSAQFHTTVSFNSFDLVISIPLPIFPVRARIVQHLYISRFLARGAAVLAHVDAVDGLRVESKVVRIQLCLST